MKKYKITEQQFNNILEYRKTKKIVENIQFEIESTRKHLNENIQLNEAIVDVLKKYVRKGLLTGAVLTSLLTNNIASADDLISAGVPKETVINISDKKFTDQEIFNELVNVLKTRGNKRDQPALEAIEKLNNTQKKQIINHIHDNIENLSDISKYRYNVIVRDKELRGDRKLTKDISPDTEVVVDTVYINANVEGIEDSFKNNSSYIINSNELKNDLNDIFNGFYEITDILIQTSSNTLRNTGDFEGLTWLQGSTLRGESLRDLIGGMEYHLGGENPSKSINTNIIKIDPTGENGDGTSGPKSPFETEDKYIESYKQRGVPEKMWKSNGKDNPYDKLELYLQHNYVKVIINGIAIDENDSEVRSYQYLQMVENKTPFKLKITTPDWNIFKSKPKTPRSRVGAYPCKN